MTTDLLIKQQQHREESSSQIADLSAQITELRTLLSDVVDQQSYVKTRSRKRKRGEPSSLSFTLTQKVD